MISVSGITNLRKPFQHGGLIFALVVGMLFPAAMVDSAPAKPRPSLQEPLSWLGVRPDEFGCFLEKTLRHKDAKFNCSLKKYKIQDDPCAGPTDEGPDFPALKAASVHKLVAHVGLEWERGEIRVISMTLNGCLAEPLARELLKLSAKGQPLPTNPPVMSIAVEKCEKGTTTVSIVAFEHMGAGEVDCGE